MINIEEKLIKNLQTSECRQLNPLVLAYLGDSVFEIYIRKYLVICDLKKVKDLNIKAVKFVKASAQSKIINELFNILTEEEQRMVKRGRNAKNTVPKNANMVDYRYATGLETLFGYLYLSNQKERLNFLMSKAISIIENHRIK